MQLIATLKLSLFRSGHHRHFKKSWSRCGVSFFCDSDSVCSFFCSLLGCILLIPSLRTHSIHLPETPTYLRSLYISFCLALCWLLICLPSFHSSFNPYYSIFNIPSHPRCCGLLLRPSREICHNICGVTPTPVIILILRLIALLFIPFTPFIFPLPSSSSQLPSTEAERKRSAGFFCCRVRFFPIDFPSLFSILSLSRYSQLFLFFFLPYFLLFISLLLLFLSLFIPRHSPSSRVVWDGGCSLLVSPPYNSPLLLFTSGRGTKKKKKGRITLSITTD